MRHESWARPEFRRRVISGLMILLPWAAWGSGPFQPKSMAYVLQAEDGFKSREKAIEALRDCGRDLVVIDYSYSGERLGKWSKKEIGRVRSGKEGRKVVAYLSIGEAENYRPYWRPVWDHDRDGRPDPGAPSFLLAANPDWPGNYRVKYWDKEWQKIILQYLTEIVLLGLDGVYLDIVDGFQTFEYNHKNNQWIDKRQNPETGRSYREDMVDWVATIAKTARKQRKDFLIIPQNGSPLLEYAEFAKVISAIGLEDFFTEGNRQQPESRIHLLLKYLKPLQKQNKPVLVIEYPTRKDLQKYAEAEAEKYGLVLLITDRALKTLGLSVSAW